VVTEHSRRPFEVERDPPLRITLLRESDSEWMLLLCMHHLISDAWSLAVFARELSVLYEAALGMRPGLHTAPHQYADFAEWHRGWLQTGVLETQLQWWKRQLAGPLPDPCLLQRDVRAGTNGPPGGWHRHGLPADLTQSLRALSRDENVTLFMVLIAGFSALLHAYSGQEDVIVGTDVANRHRLEAEGTIGFFVNALVLRTKLHGNPKFRELLARVRETTLGAYAHQDVPFHELVRAVNPARDGLRNPLFQVLFVLQTAPVVAIDLPGITADVCDHENDSAAFDVSVLAQEQSDGSLAAVFRYDATKFSTATMARMGRDYERLLARAVQSPDATIRDLRLLVNADTERPAMENPRRNAPGFDRLAQTSVRPQRFTSGDLIKSRLLDADRLLPLIVEPRVPEIDPAGWASGNREWIAARLREHGGILFRDFPVESLADFEAFAQASCDTLIEYGERSSPRTSLQGRVYSSTDHPADQEIRLHCEQSYTVEWPMRISFCCLEPAARGGRTPIAATRDITSALDPHVLDEFARRGVMYLRNYGGGMGLSWQEAFQTQDRKSVEEYCRRAEIDVEWLEDARLRTRQVRPAFRRHPATGERLWFNHALFFHISSLDRVTGEALLAGMPEADLPHNTYFGDGGAIGADVLKHLRDAHDTAMFSFAWQRGDILMLDNMLAAHGREPFEGRRTIAVGMGDPFRATAFAGV
jgi:alpha-ketoglutarate-dependent taurine dioxygenase